MDELATIWCFEPRYQRLATWPSYNPGPITYAEAHPQDHIFFYADLIDVEGCLWVYIPQDKDIFRFWGNDEAAAALVQEYPRLIFFYAELKPPEEV